MNHPGASERLQEFVADRLAAYKVPTKIWTRNEDLPTETTGKVQKKELKAFYTECVSRPDHE
jgi:acyl-coenzyme A synthetase/AMP-(fatty) acid ligase